MDPLTVMPGPTCVCLQIFIINSVRVRVFREFLSMYHGTMVQNYGKSTNLLFFDFDGRSFIFE